jgi:hypothetical protein
MKSALELTLGPQGWLVSKRSFIAGARSLNEQDLHDNLAFFKVPQAGIESIRSKLAFKIFDEYANILKGMYSTRFNGHPRDNGTHDQMDTTPNRPMTPSSPHSKLGSLITLGAKRRRKRRGLDSINTHYYIHIEGGVPNPQPSRTAELTARINEIA